MADANKLKEAVVLKKAKVSEMTKSSADKKTDENLKGEKKKLKRLQRKYNVLTKKKVKKGKDERLAAKKATAKAGKK